MRQALADAGRVVQEQYGGFIHGLLLGAGVMLLCGVSAHVTWATIVVGALLPIVLDARRSR